MQAECIDSNVLMTDLHEEVQNKVDIQETEMLLDTPEILKIILIDRTKTTTTKVTNIIWANDNYLMFNKKLYKPTSEILPELITGQHGNLIIPRALKSSQIKHDRTKNRAEVFTPTWVVKKQNDIIDANYKVDDLITYIKRVWLEMDF